MNDPQWYELAKVANPDTVLWLELKLVSALAKGCPLACQGSPFTVIDCPISPQRHWCNDLIIRLVPMMTDSNFESKYKSSWSRLVAKAAFEAGEGGGVDINVAKNTGFGFGTQGITKSTSITITNEPLMDISALWLLVSGGLTLSIFGQLLHDRDPLAILNHIHVKGNIDLTPMHEHQDDELPWFGSLGALVVRMVTAVFMLGAVLGECTLPTSQGTLNP